MSSNTWQKQGVTSTLIMQVVQVHYYEPHCGVISVLMFRHYSIHCIFTQVLACYEKGSRLGHDSLVDGMLKDGLWDVYSDVGMGVCAELCAEHHSITKEQNYVLNITVLQDSNRTIMHYTVLSVELLLKMLVPLRGRLFPLWLSQIRSS